MVHEMKTKEKDIVKIFDKIDEEEIKRAVNKVYFIKMPKIDIWFICAKEGM